MILNVYLEAFLVALFLEYPFRTMAKVVFSPPNKVIRLKEDLAAELNINVDEIFDDKDDDDAILTTNNRGSSPSKTHGELEGDENESPDHYAEEELDQVEQEI